MKRLLFSAVVLSAVLNDGVRAQEDYIYATLDVPGSSGTFAYGINNSGQIVGEFRTGSPTGPYHGFLFSGGGYTQLDVPGTVFGTIAHGINASGQIVGSYNQNFTGPGSGSAFLLSSGTYTTLPTPPFAGILGIGASGINDRGQIVGNYAVLDINPHQPPFLFVGGFLLSAGIDWKDDDAKKAEIDESHLFVSTIRFHSWFYVSILKIEKCCKMKIVNLFGSLRRRRPLQ